MIPKVIHYCWFGGNPLPESALRCIESWRKYLPDYEIKEWNESNFDVDTIRFTQEAYKLKQYAFVSDYARFWILNNFGGVYFDTDVELIKPIDDIVERGAFTGMEISYKKGAGLWGIAPGLGIAGEKGNPIFSELLSKYEKMHFVNCRGSFSVTVVKMFSQIMNKLSYSMDDAGVAIFDHINVYPKDYFCPKNYITGELTVTENTRSIHHYAATWVKKKSLFQRFFQRLAWLKIRYQREM